MAAMALAGKPLVGRVLVDGSFDNANYFFRFSLMRAALGLGDVWQIGVLGPHRRRQCLGTLQRFGVSEVFVVGSRASRVSRRMARDLLRGGRQPLDILSFRLPLNFPPATLYDIILKRQRRPQVNLVDPLVEDYIGETLGAIEAAQSIIDQCRPDLILLSHAITPIGAALAWVGAVRGIQSVVMFGQFGVPRYWRINDPDDFFRCVDRPTGNGLSRLDDVRAGRMAAIGEKYLALRFNGMTNDLGARHAFGQVDVVDRAAMLQALGWNNDRPVVAVYASNWFDFPHAMGMTNFVDFKDWVESTFEIAMRTPAVQWLFRAHPCDTWYGGPTLKDVIPESLASHIRLCPGEWPGSAVMGVADALVTCQGTAAIEYASTGKPVLVADRGWYHDCGFVVWPKSRHEYLAMLTTRWWESINRDMARRRAAIFAGWYFCVPEWQGNFILRDDSLQDDLYPDITRHLRENPDAIDREVREIRAWFISGEPTYHTFKMARAYHYQLSNIEKGEL